MSFATVSIKVWDSFLTATFPQNESVTSASNNSNTFWAGSFHREEGTAWPLEWLTGSRTKCGHGHSFIPATKGSAFPDGWRHVSFDGTSSTTLHTISRCKSQSQPNGRQDDKVIYLQSAEFSFLSLQTNVQAKCAVRNAETLSFSFKMPRIWK